MQLTRIYTKVRKTLEKQFYFHPEIVYNWFYLKVSTHKCLHLKSDMNLQRKCKGKWRKK